jgi:hypothetical protein
MFTFVSDQNSRYQIICKALTEVNKFDSGEIKIAKADAFGMPKGSAQYLSPEIQRQEFPEYFFADRGIPADPLKAAGAQEITYQRVTYIGQMRSSRSYGNNGAGKVDASFIPVTYGNKRFSGFFEVTDEEIDRLEYMQKVYDTLGQINLIQEKRNAGMMAWMQTQNSMFGAGDPLKGCYGMFTHPDVPRIQLGVTLGNGRTADENLATLTLMERSIDKRTNGVERPTTLLLATTAFHDLKNQYFTATNESVLKRFYDNSPSVKEIERVPELNGAGPNGEDLAIMYTRNPNKVVRVIPKDITFKAPIQSDEGYRVNFHGEISGVHFKRPYSAVVLEYPAA